MNKLIKIKHGILRGLVQENVLGGNYFSFKGIPYAEPPVGQLRFQDPIPWSRKWTNVRDATKHGNICAQFDKITNSVSGSDDCLYLNVYSPSSESTIPFPVMVWIHGGAFVFGSGNDDIYGPDYLLKKDVVLVTINYRINVLGFLNIGLETAPGNQGLKDQVMALKWVKENISNFGGDPSNVTIFGESAGAASVHYLTQSPLAKGLFHKAIAQSGVAINPWAHMCDNPSMYAFKLSSLLGYESTDPVKVVEFLRTVDSLKLVGTQQKLITKVEKYRFQFVCGPSVDSKSKTPFLPHPISIDNLTEVKVPLLIGHNSREGLLFLTGSMEEMFQLYNLNFAEYVHPNFHKWLKEQNLTSEDLRSFYFGNAPIDSETDVAFADYTGDMHFVSGIHEIVKLQAGKRPSQTYMYKFSYDPGTSFLKKVLSVKAPGTCHFDEVPYLFHLPVMEMMGLESPIKNTAERRFMEIFTKMWTDFAKTGNPTPSKSELIPLIWETVDNKSEFRYLNIDENIQMETMTSYVERFATRRNPRNKL